MKRSVVKHLLHLTFNVLIAMEVMGIFYFNLERTEKLEQLLILAVFADFLLDDDSLSWGHICFQ